MDNDRVSPIALLEKVVSLEGKASAAHTRIDKLETAILDDLKEIKKELKDVVGWMNRGKGWAAATLVLSGIVGGVISTLLHVLFAK